MPADLRQQAERLQSVSALARHYRRNRQTIRTWLRQQGIDTSNWKIRHMPEAVPSPHDLAQARSRDDAKRRFRIGSSTASALARAAGITWARPNRARVLRLVARHEQALRFLKTVEEERVLDLGETYGQMHNGARYSIGRRRFTAAQIIERAIMMGWRQ